MYNVMLVDDEPIILEGLKIIINWEKYGLKIIGQAENGIEALNLLKASNIHIDILIVDIKMPQMDGLELIKNVKKIYPNIKFIILSSYNDFEYVKEGIKLGIENYLLKPINSQELISTLITTTNKIEKNTKKQYFLNKDLEILKNNILYRWLTNNIEPLELNERADILKLNLEYNKYTVAIIKLRYMDSKNKFNLVSQAYDICSKIINKYNTCFCDFNNNIVIIFGENNNQSSKNEIYKILERIKQMLNNALKITPLITIGSSESSYLNAHTSYANAKIAQEYSLVMPNNKIIDYEKIKTSANIKPDIHINWKQFSKLLISKDKNKLHLFVENVFKNFQNINGITPSIVQSISIEIILKVENILGTLNIHYVLEDYKYLFNNLLKKQTIKDLKESIIKIIDDIIDYFTLKEETMSPVIIQIINYINTHYFEELSLKTLGHTFNINPTYLGQLFQKETGENFSNYVNKLRMQKAKDLLLNTNLKANEISQKIGFVDSNYFYRSFKKYVGISPTEFRNYKAVLNR